MPSAPDPPRRARLAAIAAVVAGLVVAQRLGLLEAFADPERATRTIRGLGPWGYVLYVVVYAALQPFGVPGTVLVLAASLIWPWPVAYALSMTGTMAASVVGFSFARFVARDWVAKKVPARFRRYETALERHAFLTVFALRFVFWMPPVLHTFFGVSRVRFSTHFWGSLAGYAVPLLLMCIFGPRLFEAAREAARAVPPSLWAALAGAVAIVAIAAWRIHARAGVAS